MTYKIVPNDDRRGGRWALWIGNRKAAANNSFVRLAGMIPL